MFDSDDQYASTVESMVPPVQPIQHIFPRKQNPYFNPAPKLSDFQRIRFIARGAFGQVYQYYSPAKNQHFAVKKMNFKGHHNTNNKTEIKKQIQFLYQINNPYLIKLYDHFEEGESVYLIMDYFQGDNLYQCIFKPKIQLQMNPICNIVLQICQGLQQLHRLKIVHRDLKLENILFSDGSVKIIDLGQSNIFGEGVDRYTKRGTKTYFCPQILNRQQQDDRVDSWCLGVIIYQLTTMASPFLDATDAAIEERIRRFNYRIPQKIKFEKELLDLFSKIFTWKSQRLKISEIKSHPWMKKYLNEKNSPGICFEALFSEKDILGYRNMLECEIQKYRQAYKQVIEQNRNLQAEIEKTQKKIFGQKKLI